MVHTCSFLLGLHGERVNLGVEVYMGSVGHGVHRDTVTEYQVVPVHHTMWKYTIIPSSQCPTEHRVLLNPRIPLVAQQAQKPGSSS